jgi:hypothetical protein
MKKKKITISTILLSFFPNRFLSAQIRPLTDHNSVADLLNGIVNFLYNISFLIAPLMLIVAGFLFVTSGGIEKNITRAKNILFYTFVGFLVIVLARGLINLIAREFSQ